MALQIEALHNLHQIDVQIAAAQKTLAALDNGTVLRQQLAVAEKRLAALAEEQRKSEAELRDGELNLKTIESKIQNFQNKLYAGKVTNPKELSSMEKEIEMLGKSRGKLDERILELYDVVERGQGEVKKLEAITSDLKQRYSEQASLFQSKSKELNDEIARLTAERQKAVSAVTDRAVLQRYEVLRAKYQDTGLAKVKEGKCGGCHIGLTPFSIRKLKEGADYQTCESCGRILYLDE